MPKYNPANERIKRDYFSFLKEARGQSADTVDAVAQALARFEADTQHKDFRTFRKEQATAFKRHLADRDSRATGEKLSKATQLATLAHLKRFFQWLAMQPGYRSKIQWADAEYLNFSDKDTRIATARRPPRVPTLEQVLHVIRTTPVASALQMLTMATNFVHNEERSLKSSVRLQSGGVRLTYVADADAGTTAEMAMFEKFQIGIPVFHGAGAWAIDARLKYRNNGGKLSFHYELVRPDRVHQAAAETLIAQVRDGLGDVPMFFGVCSATPTNQT